MQTAGRHNREVLWLVPALAAPLPWLIADATGAQWPVLSVVIAAGVAILGAAFLLSWAVEIFERFIPQSLAILVLALVGVLPEYAIDLHFAWAAGTDPSYAPYAIANMTGANRLLIGLGWAAVTLTACFRSGETSLEISPARRLEVRFLVWATVYSFLIPLRGEIGLLDGLVLLLLFAAYVRAAMQGESSEVELAGPARWIDERLGDRGRIVAALSLFAFAAYGIFVSAEPFADGLVEIGRGSGIDEFLLVQWVAPLASESPEFAVALLFAWKLRGSIGIGTLVSSKVNQWTLLVGAIPIAYALSSGSWSGLPIDDRQTEELLLTSAQSLLAAIVISDLRFHRREALALFGLFAAQFAFPSTEARWWFIGLYLAAALGLLVFSPRQRRAFFQLLMPPLRGEEA